ncbi:MscL family protein [Janibacter cremeus]|uniref:Large conductance mechanosensitive channel n=1 Tax=Janibacter cremeus TaxID=1285192 RepID=A0A852VU64_9MICO|nr:MscL family protein [Janibacter cremeus]NYF97814.1 large conductance mechanosensitive channel [Janibacter cremeus]
MKGFKEFLLRGNLVEIAVGLVIATSFATVVAAFTKLLLAVIAKVIGANPNFDDFRPAGLPVGEFVTACVAFLILAAVVYFGVIKPYTHLRERFTTEEEEVVDEHIELLKEIRDSLKADGA